MQSPRTLAYRRPAKRDGPLVPRLPDRERATAAPTRAHRKGPARARPAARPGSGELVLGRYRLLERLGAGGFGVVWRAYDEALQREVAIKRVEHAHAGDRAQREALATARLAHPAIAALYEARAEGDSLYLISELVHGDPLNEALARRELDDGTVLAIGVALSEALAHAHTRGVVHRDVKPANVIVLHEDAAESEHVPAKLTDFGSASIGGDDGLTRTGDVLGTLAYMAPEQSEGLLATPASDLYALALVLYEALSGSNPRRGPTPAATARRLTSEIPPLARHRANLPAALTRAIDRALSVEPRLRGTLGELRETLAGARRPVLALPRVPAPAPWYRSSRARPAPQTRFAVSRAFWWAGALAAIGWQALSGHGGLALVLFAFLAPLLALPRRAGPGWLAAGFAPVLGAVGLAGVFPALAGQATTVRSRACLAALGYWWLLLAQAIAGRRLWLWPHGTRLVGAQHWIGSIGAAWSHALRPLLSAATLEGAALWAAGAAVLPWIVRGRSAALDIVGATAWAAALVSAERLLDGGLGAHSAHVSPRGALLGAVLCGAFAVCARALRGPVSPRFRAEGGVT